MSKRFDKIELRGCTVAAIVVGLSTMGAFAAPVDLTFGDPVVTGTGVGTTALYSNIGTQDGIDIDMLATITGQNTADVHDIRRSSDDHMLDMQGADDRWVTFRYQFFESGTSNPLPIQQMVWAVDDLDGYSARTESMEVSGLTAYTVNDPTDVTVSESGGTYTFTGGGNHRPGDADSGVAMLFINQEVITITYVVLADGPSEAGFNHDGDGDFAFAAPEMTWFGPNLYYTFNLTNDEDVEVEVEFHNQLPEGMKWDTEFEPQKTGSLELTNEMLEFSEDDRTVDIPALLLSQGSSSSFTLRTVPTDHIGLMVNEATTRPTIRSGFPRSHLRASSSAVLDGPPDSGGGSPGPAGPVGDFIDDFAGSGLGRFGWFAAGGIVHMNDWGNGIQGDVGIGPGTNMNYSKGFITGSFTVDPTVTEKNGAVDDVPGTPVGNLLSSTSEDLSAYVIAAHNLSAQAAALTATQTFGEISETFTINATAPDGMNVIDVETISRGSDDWFIFNISADLKFAGGAVAVSGVPGNQILFNLLPSASEAKVDGVSLTLDATILAPNSAVDLTGEATVTGAIISGQNASMSGQATVTQTQVFGF